MYAPPGIPRVASVMTEAVNITAITSSKVTSIPKRSATSNAVNDLYNILSFFENTTLRSRGSE